MPSPPLQFEFLGEKEDVGLVAAREESWRQAKVAERVWRKDPTLWPKAPVAEVGDRMGWLDLPELMRAAVADLEGFAREVREEGTRKVVLLGMGGSSLAPHVLEEVFGPSEGYPDLTVLDSTHPVAVKGVLDGLDLARTLFVVSSKSGTTLEPLSFHRFFWHELERAGISPGPRFVAVTDPGTPLETLAGTKGFRRVFSALPTVGGRYSALTMFGLLPAALLGIDLGHLLEEAKVMAQACGPTVDPPGNPGVHLGAVLGELATKGRDKLTFYAAGDLRPFPIWVEQLVAESTGKSGTGIVPVVDEPLGDPSRYGDDRLFVEVQDVENVDRTLRDHTEALEEEGHPLLRFGIRGPYDLAAECFRWELAVALSGSVLGIDPYDQPDVELAKELARQAMAASAPSSSPATPSTAEPVPSVPTSDVPRLGTAVGTWLKGGRSRDYIAVQAYLAPSPATEGALRGLETDLLRVTGFATTMGFGPRFLHSTGQLHKGGPPTGLYLQLVDRPSVDLPVPEQPLTFGAILRAQALGDAQALLQRKRRLLRVDLGADPVSGIALIREALKR